MSIMTEERNKLETITQADHYPVLILAEKVEWHTSTIFHEINSVMKISHKVMHHCNGTSEQTRSYELWDC